MLKCVAPGILDRPAHLQSCRLKVLLALANDVSAAPHLGCKAALRSSLSLLIIAAMVPLATERPSVQCWITVSLRMSVSYQQH
jgi:hypothetical protein